MNDIISHFGISFLNKELERRKIELTNEIGRMTQSFVQNTTNKQFLLTKT